MNEEAPPQTLRQRKLRSSCDRCGAAKLRCDRSQPECTRCLSVGIACVYGVSRKAGKPPRNNRDRLDDNANSCCGSTGGTGGTGGSAGNGIVPSSGSVSSPGLDNVSTAWGKMDGYHNSLLTSVHVLDAFRDNSIDLSLPAFTSLEFDDNLSANHETEPISTLGSPELEPYTTPAEQTKPSRIQVDESIYFNSEFMLPRSSKDHNCCREAHDILGGLSLLNPDIASSTSRSAADSTSAISGTTNCLPLDHILRLNRESSEQLGYLLACSCARYPHLALLYASIISRIMIWYEQAATCSQRASWSPEVAAADTVLCHLSPSGYMTGSLSSWSSSTVNTGSAGTPTLTGATAIAVTPTHMTMGSFDIDDKQVQTALRTQLLLGEIRRTSHLIQLFASRSSSDIDEFTFGGVDSLYKSLSSWLRIEHVRITDIIQSKLKEVNS